MNPQTLHPPRPPGIGSSGGKIPLFNPLTSSEKAAITSTFFLSSHSNTTTTANPNPQGPYFKYYERELKRLRLGVPSLSSSSSSRALSNLTIKTHGDILAICDILSSRCDEPRWKVRDEIKKKLLPSSSLASSPGPPGGGPPSSPSGSLPPDEDLPTDRSINLVLRLWLMLNVQHASANTQPNHHYYHYQLSTSLLSPQKNPPIEWEDEHSLTEFVRKQFPVSSTTVNTKLGGLRELEREQEHDRRRRLISPAFTVAAMVRLCGLNLEWTDSLESHLRLDRLSKTLWVFPFKDFLVAHLGRPSSFSAGSVGDQQPIHILPHALLRETITTLNMLFPQWDAETQTLLSKHGQTFHSVGPFHGPRRLDLHEFNHWRDHLLELYEEIYLAPADSWIQLWIDRRNPHQYYTFWIALVVLLLSICSLVASVIQAWASVKALNLQMAAALG